MQAHEALSRENITKFDDKIIFITNYVLDALAANKGLLSFIYKDLSWAVFKKALTSNVSSTDVDFVAIYNNMLEESGHKFRDPEVMLFIIIELVGSTGYSAIMFNDPISLDALKPHLEQTIRSIVQNYIEE